MACTNWDADRKRRMPLAWDPPKLLLVIVSGLHVVVGTSSVVGVVVAVASSSWAPASGCDNQEEIERGERGRKATVSTHPKYSQARIYTTYAWIYV